jgi:hypothetical protein
VAIRSDNGREFIAATVLEFLAEHDVEPIFIAKGAPTQNPFVERFNGTMRRELLNLEEFNNVTEARVVIANFNAEYNEQRPHRGLGMMTPLEYARSHSLLVSESPDSHQQWTSRILMSVTSELVQPGWSPKAQPHTNWTRNGGLDILIKGGLLFLGWRRLCRRTHVDACG